jgi:putative tricarboxylic transport membrane protein
VGLLAFSELFNLLATIDSKVEVMTQKVRMRDILAGCMAVLKRPVALMRATVIGIVTGAVPGAGGSLSAAVAYQQAMTFASEEERAKFGKGSIDGLLAAEVSNNSMVGGALVPLFTLGLPGSTTDAVLLVALTYHGLVMGPEFFSMNGDVAYAALTSQFVAAIFIGIVGLLLSWVVARVVNVSLTIIIPIIAILSFVGGFAETRLTFGIWVMLCSGMLGYVMKKYNYVPLAFLLGFILGDGFEANLFRGLRMGHNSFEIFFRSNISIALWILLAATLIYPLVRRFFAGRRPRA